MHVPEKNTEFLPLLVPTPPGQVLDRMTILTIKAERTRGLASHGAVLAELTELKNRWQLAVPASSELAQLEASLRRVNSELWEVEDRLRLYESQSEFGADFVQAARSVYKLNDERFRLKAQVDALLRCILSETKVYLALDERK